jgi:hypothetical protein
MSGPTPIWAFCLHQRFQPGTGKLRFTTSETFYSKIDGDPTEVAGFIGSNYQFLFLCDEYRFGDNGQHGFGEILDFCATKLVARSVCIYPPLSLLYYLADKHNLRDPPLSELMLPGVLVPMDTTFHKTAVAASKLLKQKYPRNTLRFDKKLVAKVTNSCGGLGVFFLEKKLEKKGRKRWSAVREGKPVSDEINKEETGLTVGDLLKFQPFVEDLTTGEWRFYSYLQHHNTDKGLSNIYGVQTALDLADGALKMERMPNTYLLGDGRVLTRKVVQQMRQLFKSALDSLLKSRLPSWRGIRYLVFRFDCFICNADGKVYLNEIDLFPIAHTLMDEYTSCEQYIQDLAKCTYDYLVEHSTTNSSWSM